MTSPARWDRITDAGLNPLPVQRPIPIWIGAAQSPAAATDVVLRRIGRLADGWILVGPAGPHVASSWEQIRGYAGPPGAIRRALGLHGGLRYGDGDLDRVRQEFETWRRLGASYVCVNTMGAGLRSLPDHVEALRKGATRPCADGTRRRLPTPAGRTRANSRTATTGSPQPAQSKVRSSPGSGAQGQAHRLPAPRREVGLYRHPAPLRGLAPAG